MIFKDIETIANIYAGISKQPIHESHEVMTNKGYKKYDCKYAAKGCDCSGCKECKDNQESVTEAKKLSPAQKKLAQAAPPPDEITGADFAALKKKKKEKEMKEHFQISNFKSLYNRVLSEAKVFGCSINPKASYDCVLTNGEKKTLKGESVIKIHKNKHDEKATMKFKSVKPASAEKE